MQGHTANTRTHIHTGRVLTRESNEDRRQNQTSVSHYSRHRAQKTLPIGGGRVSVQAGGGAGGGKKKKKRLGGRRRRRRRMLRHRYLPRDQRFLVSHPVSPLAVAQSWEVCRGGGGGELHGDKRSPPPPTSPLLHDTPKAGSWRSGSRSPGRGGGAGGDSAGVAALRYPRLLPAVSGANWWAGEVFQ